jgi:hypothetical protein
MISFVERWLTRRWALPIVVLLLVLGHACELPAYAEVVDRSHGAGGSHHGGDGHHGDGRAVFCDPAAATTSNPGHLQMAAVPQIVVVSPVDDPAPARLVTGSFEGAKFAGRPSLFLLHASLLI